jgi:hypothetical protein
MTAGAAFQIVMRIVEEVLRLLPPSTHASFLARVEASTRAKRESRARAQAQLDARKKG